MTSAALGMNWALPDSWEWTTVSEVGDVSLGRQRSPNNHSGPDMHPYVRAANITWAGLDLSDVRAMNFDKSDFERFNLAPGDVLLNEGSGSASEVGKSAIWQGEIDGCCFQNTLLRVKPQATSSEYLHRYFVFSARSGRFVAATQGMNIFHIGKEGLAKFAVPLPPLAEQRRIVTKLDALTARTARARADLDRIPALAARYKQAVLAKAFDGDLFEPANSSSRATESWPTTTVGHLIDGVVGGKNLRCEERPPRPDERGVVKVSAVSWGAFDPQAAKTLPDDFQAPEHSRIRSGDFLISRANTLELVGAVVIVHDTPANLFLSDKVLRLEMAEEHKKWLMWFLRSPKGRAAIEAGSSGNQLSMRNLSQDALRKIRVPSPGEQLQLQTIRLIERMFAEIDRLTAEAAAARRLLDCLDHAVLAKAFRGELVFQDPGDEPAGVLLDRIKAQRAAAPKTRRGRKAAA